MDATPACGSLVSCWLGEAALLSLLPPRGGPGDIGGRLWGRNSNKQRLAALIETSADAGAAAFSKWRRRLDHGERSGSSTRPTAATPGGLSRLTIGTRPLVLDSRSYATRVMRDFSCWSTSSSQASHPPECSSPSPERSGAGLPPQGHMPMVEISASPPAPTKRADLAQSRKPPIPWQGRREDHGVSIIEPRFRSPTRTSTPATSDLQRADGA
jgi:hypothetical protein